MSAYRGRDRHPLEIHVSQRGHSQRGYDIATRNRSPHAIEFIRPNNYDGISAVQCDTLATASSTGKFRANQANCAVALRIAGVQQKSLDCHQGKTEAEIKEATDTQRRRPRRQPTPRPRRRPRRQPTPRPRPRPRRPRTPRPRRRSRRKEFEARQRDEHDAFRTAAPDLVRLDRYECRAWSRQKRAIQEFMMIKAKVTGVQGMPAAEKGAVCETQALAG
jgi:hypothetical protein